MSYRVKLRERKKKNKGAMLSLYLEFMPPYVAPNGECVRYENLIWNYMLIRLTRFKKSIIE